MSGQYLKRFPGKRNPQRPQDIGRIEGLLNQRILRDQLNRVREIRGCEEVTLVYGEKIGGLKGKHYLVAVDGKRLEKPIPLDFACRAPLTDRFI